VRRLPWLFALAALGPAALEAQHLGVAPAAPVRDPRLALATTTEDLEAATGEVSRLESEAQRLDADTVTLEPRRNLLRARARGEARWLYHLGQGDALALRGGPEVLLDHAARAERLRRALRGTLRELAEVERRASTLDADKARVRGLLDAARTHRAQLDAAHRSLLTVQGGAPTLPAAPGLTVYGGAAGMVAPDGFAASFGRLLFPVAGRAEVRRAWREGAEGPGVEISTPSGAVVRAVYGGRVAFADRYGAYGQIVILEHGDHYYTVCANLGRIDVRVGQELEVSQPLGTAGEDGGRGPMVYFEVRRGSETLDPVPWLGL
jgi:murein DD-endopeptidase MepM/ murein hydrolase activator NlpD